MMMIMMMIIKLIIIWEASFALQYQNPIKGKKEIWKLAKMNHKGKRLISATLKI